MAEGSKAAQYRALAEECRRLAAEVKTAKEREDLLRKAENFTTLANKEDQEKAR
jgi:hypothetical protein